MKVTAENVQDYIGEETHCGCLIIGASGDGAKVVLEDESDDYYSQDEVEVAVDCDWCRGTGGVDSSCTACNGEGTV